jgi:hypothetical protein
MSHQSADASTASLASKLAKLPVIMRTMVHHPQSFARLADTGIQLLCKGALAARDRELVIPRIGWLYQACYEWGEHEQALLRAAEELYEGAMISDAT